MTSPNKILVDLAVARESARVAAQADLDARRERATNVTDLAVALSREFSTKTASECLELSERLISHIERCRA